MMKLSRSNDERKKRKTMSITSNKSKFSSFSRSFTRVFGISSIIAIAGSTDRTRCFFEAEAAVNPIPSNTTSAQFKALVTDCLQEAGADVTGECTSWGASVGVANTGYGSLANNYGTMPNWNTSLVKSMVQAFKDRTLFNGNISSWDTSSVTTMTSMFANAAAFNKPIGNWTTSSVTDMTYMFFNAAAFNEPIGSWTTSSVKTMYGMFSNAAAFNQPFIGSWTTSSVTDMTYMFFKAATFDQDISTWTGSAANATQSLMFDGATAFQAKFACQNPLEGPPSTCKVAPPQPPSPPSILPSSPPSILPSSSSSRSPCYYTKAVALVGFLSAIAPMLWF